MFAVVKTGGKQYRVAVGDQLRVEKLAGEPGDFVDFAEILMVGSEIGAPLIDGALVAAEIIDQARERKVIAFKKRRRQNSRRTIGHRQPFTLIEITEILTDGKKPAHKATGNAKSVSTTAAGMAAHLAGGAAIAGDAGAKKKPAAKKAAPAKKVAPKAEPKKTETKKAAPKKKEAAPATSGAPLFKAPKGDAEDLTKIKGIGPVAKDQLAEQGVTQFAQVAALTDAEIVIIDEAMPFSADQISDWRAQAKEIVKG